MKRTLILLICILLTFCAAAHAAGTELTVKLEADRNSIPPLYDTGVQLTAKVSGGTEPYTYAWYEGGQRIPDAVTESIRVFPQHTTTYKVTVKDNAGIEKSDSTLVTVVQYAYGLSVTPSDIRYDPVREGYVVQPRPTSVTLSNTGDYTVHPQAFAENAAYEITTPDTWTTALASGETRNFSIRPKFGLRAGAYDDTITVATNEGVGARVRVTFTVLEPPVYGIALDPATEYAFPNAPDGYEAAASHTVSVINTGNMPTGRLVIELSGEHADAFRVSPAAIDDIAVGGTASFRVEPVARLNRGRYTAAVTLSGDNKLEARLDLRFDVVEPWTQLVFTKQPAPYTALVRGDNSERLTAEAEAVPAAKISYQWYACDANGKILHEAPIIGHVEPPDTGTIYNLPSSVSVGAYYYVCKASCAGARIAYSDVAVVAVCYVFDAIKSIIMPEAREMVLGEKAYIPVRVEPVASASSELIWRSSNEQVARVDRRGGLVTAVGIGEATITAYCDEETLSTKWMEAACDVTVKRAEAGSDAVLPRAIRIDVQDSLKLASLFGDRYVWESLDTKIVSVAKTGVLRGRAVGTATVRGSLGAAGVKSNLIGDQIELTVVVAEKGSSVRRLKLNPKTMEIERGEERAIKATVLPKGATDQTILWVSGDEDVALVDDAGVVTGRKPGKTTITAIASSGITAQTEVTVSAKGVNPAKPSARRLIFSTDIRCLCVNEVIRLDLTVSPENADKTDLTWVSADPEIATVDQTGVVTAAAEGETTITAKLGELSAVCRLIIGVTDRSEDTPNVIVKQLTLWKGDTLNLNNLVENHGQGRWTSSHPGIAAVSKRGVVTAKKIGEATMTFAIGTGDQSKSLIAGDSVRVAVSVVAGSNAKRNLTLNFKDKQMYLMPGGTWQLSAESSPNDGETKVIYWKSDNRAVATVDELGLVRGIAPGNTKVYAISESGLSKGVSVVVMKGVTEITLNKKTRTLKAGKTFDLQLQSWKPKVFAKPEIIQWLSSDSSVASVNGEGTVTGVAAGRANVKAVTASGASVICKVTVTK